MTQLFLLLMGLVGVVCLFVINLLYLQIPILTLGFFSGDAGPDGLGFLAGLIVLVRIVSVFWLLVIIASIGALARRLIPLWCVVPLVVVLIAGLPVAWYSYGFFYSDWRWAQEQKERQFRDDEVVWKVLQMPEIKSEIDLLVSAGAPVKKYTDSHGRPIVMPTYVPTDSPYTYNSFTYSMVEVNGGSNVGGKGMFAIAMVHHLSAKETFLPHSIYNVYMDSGEVILVYDGLALAHTHGTERILVKKDSGDAYANVSLTNTATTSADFVLQVFKGDSDYTISGPIKIFEGNGLYEAADATDACTLVFKNLVRDSVFISANEFCGTSVFPSAVFSGEYRPD